MILTGKAKEDFLKWVCSEYDYRESDLIGLYPSYLLDSIIIEWLDSVGIYIQVRIDFNMQSYFEFNSWASDLFVGSYEVRKEATKQAIIKANEIYNK